MKNCQISLHLSKTTDSTQIMNRLMFVLMNWLQLVISDASRDSGSDKRLINILGNKESTRVYTSLAVYFHIFIWRYPV